VLIFQDSRKKPDILFVVNGLQVNSHHFREGRKKMQKMTIRIFLTLLLLVAGGSAPVLADGSPVPLCYPNPVPVTEPLGLKRLARYSHIPEKGGTKMKRTILWMILTTLFLVASASTPVIADTFPVPLCYPNPCPIN